MVKYKIIVDTSHKKEQRFKEMLLFSIYSLAAPGQLCAVIVGTVLITLFRFWPKGKGAF